MSGGVCASGWWCKEKSSTVWCGVLGGCRGTACCARCGDAVRDIACAGCAEAASCGKPRARLMGKSGALYIEERFLGGVCRHPSRQTRRMKEKNRQNSLGMTAVRFLVRGGWGTLRRASFSEGGRKASPLKG